MKKLAAYFFIMFPVFAFGQLFPKVPDFTGNIKKVVERRYGKELPVQKKDSGIFKPDLFSGWKYIYTFEKNSGLKKRTTNFQGRILSECLYKTEAKGNKIIRRETTKNYTSGPRESIVEYENFLDSEGQVSRVNYWNQSSSGKAKDLILFESGAKYEKNKLTAFLRNNINLSGDTASGEECTLHYDAKGRLEQIRRKDISSGFSSSIKYFYNSNGHVIHYSIDLLTELQEYGREQIQDIYFKYDSHGNWTRMYWQIGEKKRLKAKRTVRYY
jgi:hypothetical protein